MYVSYYVFTLKWWVVAKKASWWEYSFSSCFPLNFRGRQSVLSIHAADAIVKTAPLTSLLQRHNTYQLDICPSGSRISLRTVEQTRAPSHKKKKFVVSLSRHQSMLRICIIITVSEHSPPHILFEKHAAFVFYRVLQV